MRLRRLMGAARDRFVRSRWNPLGTVVAVRTQEPVVALTFDDGPDPDFTPLLLDVLEAHGARATFFMIGERAEGDPALVAEVAGRGHAVGNHTHTHPSLPALKARRRREEIRRCSRALGSHERRLFRPPKGHQSLGSRLDALRCGYRVVGWSGEAEDWIAHDPGWIARRLRDRLAPGRILLLHDGLWDPVDEAAADRGPTVEAVRLLLEAVSERYRFVTLPELLRAGREVRSAWFRQP